MHIQTLKLLVSEQDVNDLARHLPDDQPLENLTIHLAPEGVTVKGEYPLFVRVAFETVWELGVQGGKVVARLADLKAMGLPAVVFKGTVLKAIEEAVQKEPWLSFNDEAITLDVDRLLAERGMPLTTNLSAIRCEAGLLIVEAAAP
jgi:hypothetical protein